MRWAGAIACLVVAAWLAVLAVGARSQDEVRRIVFQPPGQLDNAERARALELIDRAERLSFDRRPEQYRAVLALRDGHARDAAALAARLTREEPENPEAWALLARAAASYDPALAVRARLRLRALVPPVPPAR
jgi:hypothetical protein